jgi:CheY-like chemotaxis protein
MRQVLTDQLAVVTAVRTADDALALLDAHTFDVVLSDIGLPRRDGYELISEVRLRGLKIPAAAITAFARSEDRTRALLAGFQAHIAKPLEVAELVATVASLCGRLSP